MSDDYDAFTAEEMRRYREWEAYWDSLDEAGKERERQMMDAYATEKAAEREARGFDA